MDLLQRFFSELSRAFSRPIVLGRKNQVELLAPHLVACDLSLRKEADFYSLAGTLQIAAPLSHPLRVPEGRSENPPSELGFFVSHSQDFRGAFSGSETLEVVSERENLYSVLSIDFHSYPLFLPTMFSITDVLMGESAGTSSPQTEAPVLGSPQTEPPVMDDPVMDDPVTEDLTDTEGSKWPENVVPFHRPRP